MKDSNAPTEAQAAEFDRYIAKWQIYLNLRDWRIERGARPAKDAMASVEFNSEARLAVYRLGDFGSTKITPHSLESTALHELLHVFLRDLVEAVRFRARADELEAIEHRAINVLEHLLLTKDFYGCSDGS